MNELSETIQPQEPLKIDQIKKELIDPRTISRRYDAEGRQETARTVLEARGNIRTAEGDISGKEAEVQEIEEKKEGLIYTQAQKMTELTQRLGTVLVRLKKVIGVGDRKAVDMQAEVDSIQQEQTSLALKSLETERDLESLKEKQGEMPAPRELLEAYYEKIQTQPLTNEEKRKYLLPEVLASLSNEEYIALWRRLNPYFLAHVTRQGFRDHNATMYHSAGLTEFHNGFLGVLEDGKMLRSPLELQGLRQGDEASIRNYLSGWVLQAEDEIEAKRRLNAVLNFSLAAAPKYPDITAVHFTTQLVANRYYGGETNNEVFFVFPSDIIASQYNFAFNGKEKDFTKPQSETMWNDVFVWLNDVRSSPLSLNTGLVFLPEMTLVDRETGSKYASEVGIIDGKEKKVMVEDTNLIKSFIEWGKNPIDQSSAGKVVAEYLKNIRQGSGEDDRRRDLNTYFFNEFKKLGFSADATISLVNSHLFNYLFDERYNSGLTEEILQRLLDESYAKWKRAENAIPAKEYWENYFAKNPSLRPHHIIYYDGNPTNAIYRFLQKNNIGRADTSETDGQLLGFEDHFVTDMEKDPRANLGYDELIKMADKIISEKYHP